ncbi:MAG: type II secretion system protein [Clostridia bacterium]|nr:type II secretion system protein [Clostridia bacterium]
MKKSKKRGFTLVELVIVIAIIGVLSAVLIPTFSGISDKAAKSAAYQEANNALQAFLTNDDNTELATDSYIKITEDTDVYWFKYDGSKLNDVEDDHIPNMTELENSTATFDSYSYKVITSTDNNDLNNKVTIYVRDNS